ncbi:hypothetical protein DPMN_035369 [Dreissena polymorpha]|uniref:Uncharacterized protein n=1 Tax=Dreissena polymorpha TaxID=45954 RepID=A0A9D4M9F4_DREPO|nr:hypothetical protein DPMN_035369 [Dreissena polymorpha]
MAARVGFKNAVNSMIQQTVRKEVSRLCQNAQSIFKGGKSLEEMKNFSWETRYQEGVKECPMLTNVLIGATTTKNSSNYLGLASNPSTSAKPTIGTLLAIILYQRKPRIMYDLQELNSIQMWLAGCKREVRTKLAF